MKSSSTCAVESSLHLKFNASLNRFAIMQSNVSKGCPMKELTWFRFSYARLCDTNSTTLQVCRVACQIFLFKNQKSLNQLHLRCTGIFTRSSITMRTHQKYRTSLRTYMTSSCTNLKTIRRIFMIHLTKRLRLEKSCSTAQIISSRRRKLKSTWSHKNFERN